MKRSIVELSDQEILAEACKLRVAYILKTTLRYNTERNFEVHSESVAEHTFALFVLAEYFLQAEEAGSSLDKMRILQILLFHDFPEIKNGDVPLFQRTSVHDECERDAAREVFSSLPVSLSTVGYQRWREHEERASMEAKFAHALDKLEPLFELLDSINERSVRRLRITHEMEAGKNGKTFEEFPVMKRFWEVICRDMIHRGVFWEDTDT